MTAAWKIIVIYKNVQMNIK